MEFLSPVRAQTAQNERKTEMESESESRTYFVVAQGGMQVTLERDECSINSR
ncbi:hypothetical protein DAPPUDRAFT_241916 [Daphnia pulex]|uniref:Uncharacterized protein n=1 Tax=Daphnia pulex TaxID=6669 RepID=E9GFD5_DAPPU|nr:hypothetical protein DAPPUDRAFT_241916 [Daphnia pulex]|eukprot:EFX81620.1 hypothetical protein DAPPUDRAFT_241916 [Daphnia pulex]